MDNIFESLLSALLLLAIWLVPSIIKTVKGVKDEKVKKPHQPLEREEDDEFFEPKVRGEELRENDSKFPNQREYFTYETLDAQDSFFVEKPENETEENTQIVENEQQQDIKLTFEEEEIYKGIIYSEILKKKVN